MNGIFFIHYLAKIIYMKSLFIKLGTLVLFISCTSETKRTISQQDANGYTYEIVKQDHSNMRLYTLENGFQIYLKKNQDVPTIQTYIAVRAGSNYDPIESTGLAHYLEHMLFKGTQNLGTLNWEQEKKEIAIISELYEKHKKETDKEQKQRLYKKIDSISQIASKYAIANEYDKLVTSLGATGTNAHTWFEETIYKNNIPSTELNKWLLLERERFGELVLRLFHTELEAVFEEFNRTQDSDSRKMYAAASDGLFPKHPYGQQTTIGKATHLKNPSMQAIHRYFDTYYVPNNMAMVLVGDLEYEQTIKSIDATFGTLKAKPLPVIDLPKELPISNVVEKEVYGPTAEAVSVSFRSNGIGSDDEKMVTLIDMLLSNSVAGLIDLDLNQKQLVQKATSSATFLNDYGFLQLSGSPKQGQTLEEVKQLLLAQLDKIKAGAFEDWMLAAICNDMKLQQMRANENNTALAKRYYEAFIHRQAWEKRVYFLEELKKITKQEIIAFAKKQYNNNYVVVYKRQGKDEDVVKVENPAITPIQINRTEQSEFVKAFYELKSDKLQPLFVDYKNELQRKTLKNGLEVTHVTNKTNDLFACNFIFDVGADHDKKLSLAVGYLNYIGTDKLSAKELKKEFYKLGIEYGVSVVNEQSFVYISGLNENFSKGLQLLTSLLENAKADQESYDKYISKILKARENKTGQKDQILWSGLLSYAKYGEHSRLRNIHNEATLKAMNPSDLVQQIKQLKNYKHKIFYYGNDVELATDALEKYHEVPKSFAPTPVPIIYKPLHTGTKVEFVDFDMVQAEILFVAKQEEFDAEKLAFASVFNNYFGYGSSSIVFQEIRESKSLAYSAFSAYVNGSKQKEHNFVYAYIGTQANKLTDAIAAMLELMNEMPLAQKQFEASKEAALKKIAAQRITKSELFWSYEAWAKRGIYEDYRENIFNKIKTMTLADLAAFFNENIKEGNYNIVLIGNKEDVNLDKLEALGNVEELKIDYLFNYQKTTIKP